jgi:ArsR family transcriptional regulator
MDSELHQAVIKQAKICSIFSHAKRILIFLLLRKRELSVSEIAEEIGTSLQNTSQHLRLMKDRSIVQSRREGHIVYYRLADNELMDRCSSLADISQNQTEQ